MAEPVYAGTFLTEMEWWLLPREPGMPRRIVGTATVRDKETTLLTDAIVGPPGEQGQPASIIRREYGLTDPGDLPDPDILDESDYGRAWYIAGQWHVFDHGEYHVIEGSIPGPPGTSPVLSMSAEQIEAPLEGPIGEIEVQESGTSTAPHYHLLIPGIEGPEGPAASIGSASDMDDTGPAVGKVVGVVDTGPTQYGLISPTLFVPKKYTIPHNSFVAHSGSEPRFMIAFKNLPAQEYDWYPDVIGRVKLQRANILSSVQCEVEVRIGVTGASTGESEPLCGLAAYDPTTSLLDSATIAHIEPQFSDTSDPDRSTDPDTAAGRCDADVAYTVYVFVHKIGGSGSWVYVKDYNSQLRINVEPVVS